MDQLLHGASLDSVSLQYKGEAIRTISSNLQDPLRQITDETVAAVQALAFIEVSFRQHLILSQGY
jgi:hypothetical protein